MSWPKLTIFIHSLHMPNLAPLLNFTDERLLSYSVVIISFFMGAPFFLGEGEDAGKVFKSLTPVKLYNYSVKTTLILALLEA